MAIQVKEAAKGNAPNTGAPGKTPAPDEVSRVRSPSGGGHGMNGDPHGSSAPVGTRVISPLAANMESTISDTAKEALIASGMGRKTTIDSSDKLTGQERRIDDTPFPSAHGMKPRQAGGTIPSTIGATSEQPVRKP